MITQQHRQTLESHRDALIGAETEDEFSSAVQQMRSNLHEGEQLVCVWAASRSEGFDRMLMVENDYIRKLSKTHAFAIKQMTEDETQNERVIADSLIV